MTRKITKIPQAIIKLLPAQNRIANILCNNLYHTDNLYFPEHFQVPLLDFVDLVN